MAPPENEFGVSVPIRLLIARTDEVAFGLIDVVAYSTGFSLRLAIRARPDASGFDLDGLMRPHFERSESSEEKLRFGVEFADGRKATNLGWRRGPREDPPTISLVPQASGGGASSWTFGYWVWPLPPAGPLTFAWAWLGGGFPEQTQEIDASAIVEAGADSEQLWQDDRPIGPGRERGA